MENQITKEQLCKYQQDFAESPVNRVAMNAVTAKGIYEVAKNYGFARKFRHDFSVSIDTGKATNQKKSGRCWMFAALNVMRVEIMRKLNLENMELSQNYPLFYDKLEKANFFLENILATLDEPSDGRLVSWLVSSPMADGGQWDMFANLVKKYGVVPQSAMPETAVSSSTKEMERCATMKLRKFASELRQAHRGGASMEELRAKKAGYLEEIYRILSICLGTPPERFTYETRDKDKKFVRIADVTPQEFFREYVGWDLDDYVSLINAPTADKEYGKMYTVRFLGNVAEGAPVRYLNLPAEDLKQAAVAQMKDGQPVWFGSDVGKCSLHDEGVMAPEALDIDQLFSVDVAMTKAERLEYGESLMTHAMVLSGVNLDESGRPDRYRVENSWGPEIGREGYFVMSDRWFDEFVYQVVVNKKYLTAEQRTALTQPLTELAPWDPMGSLAH